MTNRLSDTLSLVHVVRSPLSFQVEKENQINKTSQTDRQAEREREKEDPAFFLFFWACLIIRMLHSNFFGKSFSFESFLFYFFYSFFFLLFEEGVGNYISFLAENEITKQ